ncbi:hypothetical protein [Streptomyces sp. AM6-12]|uniref:hypothetical protein n=1 Tax=Streptomyces sp. AM6-12 TaxID=3345149 RepID=UPI003798F090
MTAKLALGTYRCRAIPEAAARAAASGAWIDAAPNYATDQAQNLLAPVLATRPHVRIATKTGFFTAATGADAVTLGGVDTGLAADGHVHQREDGGRAIPVAEVDAEQDCGARPAARRCFVRFGCHRPVAAVGFVRASRVVRP